MKRIAVIGPSLPGLVVANALAEYKGISVTVIGDATKARSFSPMGPVYLWDGEEVRKWLWKHLDTVIVEQDIDVKHVLWVDSKCRISTKPSSYERAVYKAKTGSTDDQVCGGKSSFSVIHDGLQLLHRELPRRCEAKGVQFIQNQVKGISLVNLGIHMHFSGEGYEPQQYDAVVNTVDRVGFEALRGRQMGAAVRETWFHATRAAAPVAVSMLSQQAWETWKHCLYYNGDPLVKWFRSTFQEDVGWVFEAPEEMPPPRADHPWSKVVKVPAKMVATEYPADEPRIIHVGRWAEMQSEMMVSDVIARLPAYLEKIID